MDEDEFTFHAGDDVTHLFRVVVSADADGDADYSVDVKWLDRGDLPTVMSTYVDADTLDRRHENHKQAAAIKAVTEGGISEIEAFLEG